MAKKFGKFLLFTAAAATTAAGVCYYLKKKSENENLYEVEDEDYDDFSEDLDAESRSYVQLDPGTASEKDDDFLEETENVGDGDFSPLAQQLQEKNNEQVEEFFDEEN